eukprot:TRINITY_DN63935_c0_g1_i1.p1 TRINITY_DN63935_c0_g1~~TRINITY_DN63935_c0_g1_i1.p1  ORF type:complete len:598 (-),score=107.12 TRINITY_DN63935_c0_g1_i1:54-1847(-)
MASTCEQPVGDAKASATLPPALLGRERSFQSEKQDTPSMARIMATKSTMATEADDVAASETSKQEDSWLRRKLPAIRWLQLLHQHFGGFVPMSLLQYGLNQGLGGSVGGFVMRYYMMDVLKLDGATMGRFTTAASLPWNIKPCIGMLSDAVPLFGFHRTSYIAVSGICGLVAYFCLGMFPLSAFAAVPFMILINFSISTSDVIIDAKAAELAKEEPRFASDLQSLLWGVMAVGGLLSCSLKGPLLEWLGPKGVLLTLCSTSLGILIPSLLRWLPETRLPSGQRCVVKSAELCQHPAILALASFMSLSSVILSGLQIFVDHAQVRGIMTVFFGVSVAFASFRALVRITPYLAKTALFIFLRQCVQPGLGEAMFVWLTKSPEGPQFSAHTLGWIDCFGSVGLLAGVTIYNKYMTHISYRKIFLYAQMAYFLSNILDIVLVKRWNLMVGIPDFVFIVGDDTFGLVVSRFFSIPLFVLASKVCPDNLEATLFAMLMSLSNFGSTIGSFLGVTLCEMWGLVDGNFDHLPEAVLAKSLFRLLPIPLIFMLTPNISPCDPIPDESTDSEVLPARPSGDVEEALTRCEKVQDTEAEADKDVTLSH